MVTEKDMRRAFGMDTFKKAKQIAIGDKWYIKFSVRDCIHGTPQGPTKIFEGTYPTFSGFDAEMMARKEMKKAGLVPWVMLDSHKVKS